MKLKPHHLKGYDLVINVGPHAICARQGTIDANARILASHDSKDCEQKYQQRPRANPTNSKKPTARQPPLAASSRSKDGKVHTAQRTTRKFMHGI